MAGQQKRLAQHSKRDSTSMKTLSLLGAIFIPAGYVASVFGMEFNWELEQSQIWIYFAITGPITMFILIGWWYWNWKRERKHKTEDEDLEQGIDDLERKIMLSMRTRTMSKQRTWSNGLVGKGFTGKKLG